MEIQYDEKAFEPEGVFGSRGLGTAEGRRIVKARPHVPYQQGSAGYAVVLDPKWWGWQLTEGDAQIIKARIDRAPGILMVRHTVQLLATAGKAGLGRTRILYRRADVERLRVERGVGRYGRT